MALPPPWSDVKSDGLDRFPLSPISRWEGPNAEIDLIKHWDSSLSLSLPHFSLSFFPSFLLGTVLSRQGAFGILKISFMFIPLFCYVLKLMVFCLLVGYFVMVFYTTSSFSLLLLQCFSACALAHRFHTYTHSEG